MYMHTYWSYEQLHTVFPPLHWQSVFMLILLTFQAWILISWSWTSLMVTGSPGCLARPFISWMPTSKQQVLCTIIPTLNSTPERTKSGDAERTRSYLCFHAEGFHLILLVMRANRHPPEGNQRANPSTPGTVRDPIVCNKYRFMHPCMFTGFLRAFESLINLPAECWQWFLFQTGIQIFAPCTDEPLGSFNQ